jgi:uncharacterized RDD family membrane protein YckC
VKCPKCGFVGYPGAAQCKKCGHHFLSERERSSSSPNLFSGKTPSDGPPTGPHTLEPAVPELPVVEAVPLVEAPINTPVAVSAGLTLPETGDSAVGETPAWREELSQRVASFRRRRARSGASGDSSPNLELDFEGPETSEAIPTAEIMPEEASADTSHSGREWDELQHHDTDPGAPHMESLEIEPRLPPASALGLSELDRDEPGTVPPASSALEISDLDRPEPVPDARLYRRSVEFVLDSSPRHPDPEPQPTPLEIHMAPMGRRFLGGIIDLAVLGVSAGVFALIFWRAGGRMSAHPLNMLVVGLITAFLVLAYFGAFTALTSTTPGLLWMGIEVRNLRGDAPTLRESFWRAFGYLVSASALLLGFVWALVDSEGLTWHDRMSDTFLTTSDAGVDRQESTLDS